MKNKVIVLLFILFIGISNVSADCSYSDISRLKSIVSNINLSYDYREENDVIYYDITINNLTPDIYFYDSYTKQNYYYSNTIDGEITIYGYTSYNTDNGSYKFYSNLDGCNSRALGTKYYNLPKYNEFYSDSICKEIPNFSLCQKFIENNYSYDEFIELAEQYKLDQKKGNNKDNIIEYEKDFFDKFVDLYVNYYYYFFIGVIVICSIIMFIKRDKNKFKL